MISIENKELLEQLGKLNHGRALREYLDDEIKKLDSLTETPETEDFEEVCRANKRAVKIIRRLFSFLEGKEESEKKGHQYV